MCKLLWIRKGLRILWNTGEGSVSFEYQIQWNVLATSGPYKILSEVDYV